jgi:hypothetical protein
MNGIIPPTNTTIIGTATNNYWGWHLIMAGLAKLFVSSPIQMIVLNNTIALTLYLFGFWYCIRKRIKGLALGLVLLFPLTLFPHDFTVGIWVDLINSLSFDGGKLIELKADERNGVSFLFPYRKLLIFHKFLTFNGFGMSMGLFFALFATYVSMPKKPIVTLPIFAFSALAVLCHPVTIFAIAFMLMSAGLITLLNHGWKFYNYPAEILYNTVACILGVLVTLPYVFSLSSALEGTALQIPLPPAQLSAKLNLLGWAAATTIPWLILGVFRFKHLTWQGKISLLTSIILLTSTFTITLAGVNNQYKFLLLYTTPLCVLFVDLYAVTPFLRKKLASVLILLLIILITPGHIKFYPSLKGAYYSFDFSKTATNLKPTKRKAYHIARIASTNAIGNWLRNNTNPKAYFFEPPQGRDSSLISLISQRRTVVNKECFQNKFVPYFYELVSLTEKMTTSLETDYKIDIDLYNNVFQLDIDWPETLYIVTKNAKGIGLTDIESKLVSNDVPIKALFATDMHIIYSINSTQQPQP